MKMKTYTVALPADMADYVYEQAKQEKLTVDALMREIIRQYRAKRAFGQLAKQVRAAVKKHGLTPEDFGGPFED